MSKVNMFFARNDEESSVTVFVPGEVMPYVAHSSHPAFQQILDRAMADDVSVIDLFDIAVTVSKKFNRLSERVTEKDGHLFLDGVEVNNALTDLILRDLTEGGDHWESLVAFFEKVLANPSAESREQLYNWLAAELFSVDSTGDLIGYKGVRPQYENDGYFLSISKGPGVIVNGEEVSGEDPVRQTAGDIVEMARDQVNCDPRQGCSTGLHVGTWSYASSFSQGAILEVRVNPRDVVSVPSDSSNKKVRCCRYRVVGATDAPHTSAVLDPEWDSVESSQDDPNDVCTECGESYYNCECDDDQCAYCDSVTCDGECKDVDYDAWRY